MKEFQKQMKEGMERRLNKIHLIMYSHQKLRKKKNIFLNLMVQKPLLLIWVLQRKFRKLLRQSYNQKMKLNPKLHLKI